MSDIAIQNNTLIYPFNRGIGVTIIIDSQDIDFSDYLELYADVKEEQKLDQPALLSFELNDGIDVSVVGEFSRLILSIDEDLTKNLGGNKYFLDIKGRVDISAPIFLIARIQLKKDETVTNVPNVT